MPRGVLPLVILMGLGLVLAPTTSAQVAISDVVRLNDGGYVRGVIIEHDPASHVSILLPDGTTRRFEVGVVAYAGPAPASTNPATTPSDVAALPSDPLAPDPSTRREELRPLLEESTFETEGEQLALYIVHDDGRTVGGRICSLPCRARIRPGVRRFAVGRGDSSPRIVSEWFTVTGPARFDVRFIDNSALRIAGWVTLIAGLVTGAAIAIPPLSQKSECYLGTCGDPEWALGGAGLAIAGVSLAVGLGLSFAGDGVDIDLGLRAF